MNDKKPEMPTWFARALGIAQLADRLGLTFGEAEWLADCNEKYPHPIQVPKDMKWYVEWLFSKSTAVLATRRKRTAQ